MIASIMTPGPASKQQFYMEMAKLLGAGFDIRKAAGVMESNRLPAAQVLLLRDLKEGLDAGESITDAFSRDAGAVSGLERSMIAAGERGGKLAPAFQHLADYFAMVASARREMIKGMIYPMIVLHLGVLIGTIPISITGEAPNAGEVAGNFAMSLLVLYLGAAVLFFLGRMVLQMAPDSPRLDAAIHRIPWIGKARKHMAMARFCKVYHACLLAGISMVETVRVSADSSQSGELRRAGRRVADVAKEGNSLGPAFMGEAAFPADFSRSYAIGEEAGTLDTDLGNWARLFQEKAEGAMKTASEMVPKVLYFCIMAFVAWKIIGFFTGYYSALDAIGE